MVSLLNYLRRCNVLVNFCRTQPNLVFYFGQHTHSGKDLVTNSLKRIGNMVETVLTNFTIIDVVKLITNNPSTPMRMTLLMKEVMKDDTLAVQICTPVIGSRDNVNLKSIFE